MIKGFNAYKKGLVDFTGKKFELNKTYHVDALKYGKSGFFFYPNFEDSLMPYNGLKEELDIVLVEGFGETREYFDDYNVAKIIGATDYRILDILPRKEIIKMALSLNELEMSKFISGYALTMEEMKLFDKIGDRTRRFVDYYQRGDKDVFEREFEGNAKRIGQIKRTPNKG